MSRLGFTTWEEYDAYNKRIKETEEKRRLELEKEYDVRYEKEELLKFIRQIEGEYTRYLVIRHAKQIIQELHLDINIYWTRSRWSIQFKLGQAKMIIRIFAGIVTYYRRSYLSTVRHPFYNIVPLYSLKSVKPTGYSVLALFQETSKPVFDTIFAKPPNRKDMLNWLAEQCLPMSINYDLQMLILDYLFYGYG